MGTMVACSSCLFLQFLQNPFSLAPHHVLPHPLLLLLQQNWTMCLDLCMASEKEWMRLLLLLLLCSSSIYDDALQRKKTAPNLYSAKAWKTLVAAAVDAQFIYDCCCCQNL